LDVFRRNFS